MNLTPLNKIELKHYWNTLSNIHLINATNKNFIEKYKKV
tara:strand:+ start:160 stop:276 length:117 start_codon:yes stop_codon:yes gene_type:complete